MLKNYYTVCFYELGLGRRRTDDNSNIRVELTNKWSVSLSLLFGLIFFQSRTNDECEMQCLGSIFIFLGDGVPGYVLASWPVNSGKNMHFSVD